VHLLSLLLMVANLSSASVALNSTPLQPNHVIVADGPEWPPDYSTQMADGPEWPPTSIQVADGPEWPPTSLRVTDGPEWPPTSKT